LIVNAGTLSLADTLSVVNSSSSTANNGAIQIGSVIAGTGAITLRSEQAIDPNMSLSQARGAIRLTAANTYVGTTAIEKGLVVFTNTTATTSTVFGTNAANIITLGNAAAPTDNAALGFQTSGASGANVIMSQPIVVAAGSGTRTIAVLPNTAAATYTITYSGAITLNSDVMLYNPDTVTGAVNGGTVAVGNFTGTISGTGGIKKTGDGIIFLNAPGGTTSSYSGDTVVDAGFLVTGNTVPNGAGRGNVIVNSGGTYSISNNETINGLSGSGAIRPYGGTVRTLTIGDNDQSSLFSGTIGGTRIDTLGAINFNIAKTGTGTLTLSGANTYNGTTTVNGGTLLVNGSHTTVGTNPGGYTVNTGGTLGGTGSIARNITLAGGTLAPGASIESLDITGTVSLNSGAFHWEFSGGPPPLTNAPVGADVLNVSGALTIATATNITGANLGTDLLAGTKFVAISYNSTLTGVFGNALLDDDFVTIGGNQFIINYDDINFSGAINFNQALYGTAVTLTAIPEPSSILGLGFVGAIMIGAARIRKQYTLRRISA
jgi:autotransporter-associated beta strand protein